MDSSKVIIHLAGSRLRKQKSIPTRFRVRSGRHSYEGYSVVEDGIVIGLYAVFLLLILVDVSHLSYKSYDTSTKIGTFGSGVRYENLPSLSGFIPYHPDSLKLTCFLANTSASFLEAHVRLWVCLDTSSVVGMVGFHELMAWALTTS